MRCVVVVEDEPAIARVIGAVLEDAGYRVCLAGNGREALAIIGRERPAAVLTDQMMPAMGGLELAAAIKADPALRPIPVALMSAVREPASDGVYQAFLPKPFDLGELLAVVARLTGGPPDPEGSPG